MNDVRKAIITIRELHERIKIRGGASLLDFASMHAAYNEFYDQPIKSSKWKILVFLIDGISGVTICSFNTKEEAAQGVQAIHEQIKLFPEYMIKDFLPNLKRFMREIHHAIPIPIKE